MKLFLFHLSLNLLLMLLFLLSCSEKSTSPDPESISYLKIYNETASNHNMSRYSILEKIGKSFVMNLTVTENSDLLFKLLTDNDDLKYYLNYTKLIDDPRFLQHFLTQTNVVEIGMKNTMDLKNELAKLFPNGIDIYFPIKDHRNNYRNQDDLYLVVYPVGTNEEDIELLTAFNKQGEKILLSIDELPEIPTMVISPSERRNKNITDDLPPCDPEDPEDPCNNHGGGGNGGGGNGNDPIYLLELEDINLIDDHELWINEPAELYFKVRFHYGTDSWQKTFTPWSDYEGWKTDKFLPVYSSTEWGIGWDVEVWEDDEFLTGEDDKLASWITDGNGILHVDSDVQCRFVRDIY